MARKLTRTDERAAEIEAQIVELDTVAEAAKSARQFFPATRALAESARLRAELARVREAGALERERDPIKRTRRLRLMATSSGSFVAAEKLLRQERELMAQVEAERVARQEAEAAARDPQVILRWLEDGLAELPDALAEQIEEACRRRREVRTYYTPIGDAEPD